jgi:hypothetical protein
MQPDTVVKGDAEVDTDVMASVEEGRVDQFILADISQDEAYLTMPVEDAVSLSAWR